MERQRLLSQANDQVKYLTIQLEEFQGNQEQQRKQVEDLTKQVSSRFRFALKALKQWRGGDKWKPTVNEIYYQGRNQCNRLFLWIIVYFQLIRRPRRIQASAMQIKTKFQKKETKFGIEIRVCNPLLREMFSYVDKALFSILWHNA